MTDLKKRKKRRKKLLKSKAASVIISLSIYIIFVAILCGLFMLMCIMTFEMQVNNSLSGELEKAAYIEKIYAGSDDEQSGISLLDGSEMDYILYDKQGNVVRKTCEDTRVGEGVEYFHTTSFSDNDDSDGLSDDELMKRYTFYIYNDKESDILTVGSGDDTLVLKHF